LHLEDPVKATALRTARELDLVGITSSHSALVSLRSLELIVQSTTVLEVRNVSNVHTATRALARASVLLRETLGRNELKKLLLVVLAQHMDLLDGVGIKPDLAHLPKGREYPRSVDDVELAQTLWIIVLIVSSIGANELEGQAVTHAESSEIDHRAEVIHDVADTLAALLATLYLQLHLIEMVAHEIIVIEILEGGTIVNSASLFIIDGAALLIKAMVGVRYKLLEEIGLGNFRAQDLVNARFLTICDVFLVEGSGMFQIELTCSQESKSGVIIDSTKFLLELTKHRLLRGREIAKEATHFVLNKR